MPDPTSDHYWEIPPQTARKYWQDQLQRVLTLYKQTIHDLRLELPCFSEAIAFADALGVATIDDAVIQAMKANPEGVTTFLEFALMLGNHYVEHPDQFETLALSKRGQKVPPFLFVARSVQSVMERWLEHHGILPSK